VVIILVLFVLVWLKLTSKVFIVELYLQFHKYVVVCKCKINGAAVILSKTSILFELLNGPSCEESSCLFSYP
jgi:hypothetical protein